MSAWEELVRLRFAGDPAWLLEKRLDAARLLPEAVAGLDPATLSAPAAPKDTDGQEPVSRLIAPELEEQGVVFMDLARACREREDLTRRNLYAAVPAAGPAPWAALSAALWTDGSLLFIPEGVEAALPIQAQLNWGDPGAARLERSLIVLERGASARFLEGCTAPAGLHAGLRLGAVEALVGAGATLSVLTLQAWPRTVENVALKRAVVARGGMMTWLDANLGSKTTLKVPELELAPGARGQVLAGGYAGAGQSLVLGGKGGAVRLWLAEDGGRIRREGEGEAVAYRPPAPEQADYLASRGLDARARRRAWLSAFFAPLAAELPLEFAVEFERLLELEAG